MLKRILMVAAALVIVGAGFWYATRPPAPPAQPPVTGPTPDTSGFARALAPQDFTFPRDHGPHFDYQTEWWYYTGNLTAEDGGHFGYQLTIFRRGLSPGAPPAGLGFSTNQIYFAHFAITDVAGNLHRADERFSRGASGLAGASGQPFQAWLEDWRVDASAADGSAVHLTAAMPAADESPALAIDLTLRAVKPLTRHGDRGLSAKSDQPGNASYYLSFTRLDTDGALTARGQTWRVSGESWFDHEWSTSVLGPQAVGWDWFSLQLSDGRDLMLYYLRRQDGSYEPVSGGTLVAADGATMPISAQATSLQARGQWTSPRTGVVYPSGWTLSVPAAQLELSIAPWLQDQEMQVSFKYWEGAVRVAGTSAGAAVTGNGYVELTGYQNSMQGVLGNSEAP